jgi:hypothetical protein
MRTPSSAKQKAAVIFVVLASDTRYPLPASNVNVGEPARRESTTIASNALFVTALLHFRVKRLATTDINPITTRTRAAQ